MSNGRWYVLQLGYPMSTNPQMSLGMGLFDTVIEGASYSVNVNGAYMIDLKQSAVEGTLAAGQQKLSLNSAISGSTGLLSGEINASVALSVDVTLRLLSFSPPVTIATLAAGTLNQAFSVPITADTVGLTVQQVLALFESEAAAA